MSANERLEAFEAFWRRLWPQMDILDGDDVVEAAEYAGLIKIEPHPQPCENETCPCDGEFTELYVQTPLATGKDR